MIARIISFALLAMAFVVCEDAADTPAPVTPGVDLYLAPVDSTVLSPFYGKLLNRDTGEGGGRKLQLVWSLDTGSQIVAGNDSDFDAYNHTSAFSQNVDGLVCGAVCLQFDTAGANWMGATAPTPFGHYEILVEGDATAAPTITVTDVSATYAGTAVAFQPVAGDVVEGATGILEVTLEFANGTSQVQLFGEGSLLTDNADNRAYRWYDAAGAQAQLTAISVEVVGPPSKATTYRAEMQESLTGAAFQIGIGVDPGAGTMFRAIEIQ